jgi:autotransporter-associated beta strand protein
MKIKSRQSSFLFASALLVTSPVQAQQYWDIDGIGAVINTANWSASPGGPFTSAFTTNGNIVFGANSTVTGATVDIGNVTVNDGVIVNFTAGGTLGTGGNVRTLNVGTGAILNLSSQALSVAVGTGFIKDGAGILFSSNGNTYAGGFTLNAGTVIVGGVNAMGGGGVLNINGGTIVTNAARDLTGKYTNIVIGGNFGIGGTTTGVAAGNGIGRFQITFSNTMDLGAATRTITSNGVGIFGGVISGATGVGITKEGSGAIVLAGTANTYSGPTQVNAGTLSFRTGTADSTSSTYTFGAGTTLGLGVGAGRFTDAEVAAAFLGTVPASLSTVTIDAATNISLDTTVAAHTFATAIGVTTRGLEKIIGGNNLTLSGANQYSGRTVVGGGGALLVSALGNIGDTSSNAGTNSTIDLMKDGRIDISTASSSNKNFNIQGTAAEPSIIFPGTAGAVVLSGSISTETAGPKQISFGTNAALTVAHEVSGIISDGSGTLNVRKINPGRIVFSGANTYTGTTTVAAGTLQLAKQTSLYNNTEASWTKTNITVSSGGTLALNVGGTGQFTTGNVTTLLTNLGTSITNNGLLSGSFVGIDTTNAVGGTFTIADNIANSTGTGAGAVGLTKLGTNTLVVSGNNTNTGITTINGGTLLFAKQASLYNNTPASWTKTNIIVNTGGTLGLKVGGTGEFTTANVTTLLANLGPSITNNGLRAGSTIAFDTTNATGGTFSVADIIADSTGTGAGAVGLTKLGTNELILNGPNTYSGTTTVSAGKLSLGAAGALPSTSPVNLNGGTLLLNGITTTGASLTLSGSTSSIIDLAGTSLLTFNAVTASSFDTNTLSVWNWTGTLGGGGLEQLKVPNASLNAPQLGNISFYSGEGSGFLGTATFAGSGSGELVPVPEPSPLLATAALGAAALLRRRRDRGI